MAKCSPDTLAAMANLDPTFGGVLQAREDTGRSVGVCAMELFGDMYADDGGSACRLGCALSRTVEDIESEGSCLY